MDPLRTGVALVILAALAWAVARALGLERPWLHPWALARAALQLMLLALLLGGVVTHPPLVAAFLAVMVSAAAWVVARRLAWGVRGGLQAVAVLGAAVLVPCAAVFASGALLLQGNQLLAFGGIVIGNAMTASTLFNRSLDERLRERWAEVEGWLSLGASMRRAVRDPLRAAGGIAVFPSVDQTRVTGLVTLPGAFVGAVFAGARVGDAAQFQLLVLAGVLAANVTTVALWSLLQGAPRTAPAP